MRLVRWVILDKDEDHMPRVEATYKGHWIYILEEKKYDFYAEVRAPDGGHIVQWWFSLYSWYETWKSVFRMCLENILHEEKTNSPHP